MFVISNLGDSKMIPRQLGAVHVCSTKLPYCPKLTLASEAGLAPRLAPRSCSTGPKCAIDPANNLTARANTFVLGILLLFTSVYPNKVLILNQTEIMEGLYTIFFSSIMVLWEERLDT